MALNFLTPCREIYNNIEDEILTFLKSYDIIKIKKKEVDLMKDIRGYEGLYAVTSCGKVWSYRSKKFLKPAKDRYGYLQVGLCKDNKQKWFLVHKLMALAYVPNPDNLDTVDHINGNKEQNYVKNLQWLTRADNVRKEHNVKVRCVETNEVFESIIIAAKEKGLDQSNVSKVCNGKRKTTGGYHFEFV